MLVEEGKTGVPGEKPLGAKKEPTTNLAHTWSVLRIEPGPHRWEASALTTAPALLPDFFESGRKIAPNTGANATKFFTLATKS